MKSLGELKAFKQKALDEISRGEKEQMKIIVGMGTCGIASGARETLASILEELGRHELTEAIVTKTGCIGFCVKEPMVDIFVPGQPKVTYGNVDAVKARQIVSQHLVNGSVVFDWVVNKL